jgi:uncharacterized protein (DUF1501 family)
MSKSMNSFKQVSRRRFLQTTSSVGVGSAAMFSAGSLSTPALAATKGGQAKNVIYIFVNGGLSHVDSFDPKPKNKMVMAGTSTAIDTKVDGVQLGHRFGGLAKQMDKCCLIRSMHAPTASHGPGCYLAHTNYKQQSGTQHPSLGAWVSKLCAIRNPNLPSSVVIHESPQGLGSSAGYMGAKFSALPIGDAQKGLQHSKLPAGVTAMRQNARISVVSKLNQQFVQSHPHRGVVAHEDVFKSTIRLMGSEDLAAFEIHRESQKVRERYGSTEFGQGCLLARRLVERKVRFVEVMTNGWDHHGGIKRSLDKMAPFLDQGIAALLEDLSAVGLLEETLVVVATEFGRKPMVNARGGRDHHPGAYSHLLAGGGVRGGQVYGQSDDRGHGVQKKPVSVHDFYATIGHAVGVDPNHKIKSPSNRSFTMGNKGDALTAIF